MNMTVNRTDMAEFTVEATGDDLTYQWQVNGTNLTETPDMLMGVDTESLIVLDAMNDDEGSYTCEVTNGAGDSVTSNEAFLTVGGYCETVQFP